MSSKNGGRTGGTKVLSSPSAPAFDLDNPELSPTIEERALGSGGFPYDEEIKKKVYKGDLARLQLELLKLQAHIEAHGERLVVLFEGRDASGKGSCISRFVERLNPRHARSVALSKPTETERGQWYFQRYVAHLPTAGDIVLFDRSWYNRAGVERVMGFCTPEQVSVFLRDAPDFEALLVRDGIRLFKLYLTIGREMQLKRFHELRHDPFKMWKITDIDRAAIAKWDDYTQAQRDIFRFTNTPAAPWTVIRANDQRRARLEAIRTVLSEMSYDGKDTKSIGKPDPLIVGSGPEFFDLG
jgi:polyphosphate kinase 2